jgi:hypothetical protein
MAQLHPQQQQMPLTEPKGEKEYVTRANVELNEKSKKTQSHARWFIRSAYLQQKRRRHAI